MYYGAWNKFECGYVIAEPDIDGFLLHDEPSTTIEDFSLAVDTVNKYVADL